MVSNLRHFDLARRVAGYAVSAILASLIYVVWLTVSITGDGVGTHPGLIFGFGFGLVFLFVGGFALALLLMIVPWAIAVWAHFKTRWTAYLFSRSWGLARLHSRLHDCVNLAEAILD